MRSALKLLALAGLGGVVGALVWVSAFVNSQAPISIGAHSATMSPTLTGRATILAGPLLPELRMPLDAPMGIGVEIILRDSPVTDFEQILASDAAIASQPAGEIRSVTAAVEALAREALVEALAAAILAMVGGVLVWKAVGPQRRASLLSAWPPERTTVVVAVATGAVVVGCLAVLAPDRGDAGSAVDWVPLRQEFPELPDEEILANVEVARGAATAGGRALLEGAMSTYRESRTFYSALAEKATGVEVRTPTTGQTTAVVVTDRHDNVGMDPVAKAVADAASASFVIDLGDDTSNGGSWEAFSLNSLRSEFADLPVVAIAGNHDQGTHVPKQMAELGFTVLDGERVEVDGIGILGASDPRSSGLTAGYNGNEGDNIQAIKDQDAALGEVACSSDDITLLMVHSMASATRTAARGCVDLVLAGHLHRQVGPTTVAGDEGTTTTLTIGSTGGAVYAFALGSKLRREAQVAIVTFESSRAVGVQVVSFRPGGIISVGPYTPVGPALAE